MANLAAAPTIAVGLKEEPSVADFSTTSLHSLAAAGDRDAVLEMLDGGGVDAEELNRRDSGGLTPLHSAIQGNGLSFICKVC